MSAREEPSGVPGIYRRGGTFTFRITDPTGRVRRLSCPTLNDAITLRALLRDRDEAGWTLQQFGEEWVNTFTGRTANGVSPETLAEYAAILKRHVYPHLGDHKLRDLEPRDIAIWLHRLQSPRRGRRTLQLALGVLRMLLQSACEQGLIRWNAASGLRPPGDRPEPTAPRREEEIHAIAEHCPPRERLLVVVAAATGLRRGELLALRWQDITGARITVKRSFRHVERPLRGAALRDVPISAAIRLALERHRGQAPAAAASDLHPSDVPLPAPITAFDHLVAP